jgi:glycosyltransferase involved in cell wall biosynthesis
VNILHLEDEPWDSGMAHYATTLAAEQSRRGHAVEFWGRADSPVLGAARALGLRVRGFPGGAAVLARLPAMSRLASDFSPEVIDAHTGSSHLLALALARSCGAAVVRTRGDARPAKGTPLTRLVAARTRAFIAANSALESSLRAAFPGARVARVPQGIAGPVEVPPLPGSPLVGMLARFDPVKGHEVLLDAMRPLRAKVPAARALCAGDGRLLDRLRWQLKPAGLEDAVSFPGRVSDPWSFAAGCRVGVVPSLGSEAVSRAALEWMASGRPVVASAVGGLPDLVDHGRTGLLVPPGDPKALAAALAEILGVPGKAEEMGRQARGRWQARFSPDPFYDATQRAYEEALHDLPS